MSLMKNIFLPALIALSLSSFAQDLGSVLANTSFALGLDARKKISGLSTQGYVVMSGTEARIPFRLIQARPDLLRIETTVFGFKAIQTYDGSSAWMLTPTQGLEAVSADPRDMEFLAAATALDGPFSINKNNKYQLKYRGIGEYSEKQVHQVSWVSETERFNYYINSVTWLVDGVRYEYKKNGGWYSMEYRVKSYSEHFGTKFPQRVTAVVNGVEMLTLEVSEVTIIDKPASSLFGKPAFN